MKQITSPHCSSVGSISFVNQIKVSLCIEAPISMATEITMISNTACLLQVVLKSPHSVTRHLKHLWSYFHSFQCLSRMSTIGSVSRGPLCHNVSLEASHLIDQRCTNPISTYHPPLWFLHSLHSGFELTEHSELRGTAVRWWCTISKSSEIKILCCCSFHVRWCLFLKHIFRVMFFKDKSTYILI